MKLTSYYVAELLKIIQQNVVNYLSTNNLSMFHFYDVKEKMLLRVVENHPATKEQLLAMADLGLNDVFKENIKEFVNSKMYNSDVGMLMMSQLLLCLNETALDYIHQKVEIISEINDKIEHMGVKYSQKILLS